MSNTITFKAGNNREVELHAKLWNEAKARTEGKGDGRIGEDDAKALFAIISADNEYSEIEKKTLKFIRSHYRFTAKGDSTFRQLVRSAAAKGWNPDDVETTSFKAGNGRDVTVVASLWAEAQARTEGKGDGRLGIDDAEALFELIAADNEYSELEKKTVRHIRKHFKWTEKGDEKFRNLIRLAAGKGWSEDDINTALSDED